jgi:general secretion pathway protein D
MSKKNKPGWVSMRRSGHGAIAAAVLLALGTTGCEYLGAFSKPYRPPESIKIQPVKEEPKSEADDASKDQKKPREKEYYPARGRTYGSPGETERSYGSAESGESKVLGGGRGRREREGKYTLNFDDADLGEVSKVILGDTLKVNYVLSPKVAGKVSLQTARPLADDELIPTLEMLLRMNGAVLIKEGSLYKIEPEVVGTINAPGARLGLSGDLPPGYQLRVVPLRYVSVQEMQKVIEPLMPPKSVIRADEVRNLLLLAGSSDELASVMDTIRIFDVDFMRGMSVAIFPLKNVDAGTIAGELESLLGSGSKGPMAGMLRLLPIERLNAVMAVSPQPRYLDEVETWVERLDRYTTDKSGNMHVYRVQNVDAMELANTLGQIFGTGGRSGGPRASVAPGMSGASIGSGSFGSGSGGIGSGSGSSFGGGSSSFGGGSSSFGGTGGGFSDSGDSFGSDGGSSSSFGGSSSSTSGSSFGSSSTGSSRGGFGGSSSSSGGGFGGSSSFGSGGGSAGRRSAGRGGAAAMDLGNNIRVVADPANNALIIFAKPADYKEIESVIKELDVMPMQVLIDATVVEVALTGDLQYGLKWYFEQGESGWAQGSEIGAIATAAAGGFTYSLVNASKNIRVQLNLLAKDNKINVLSSPSLMVLNNQEAQINVGDRVPTPTATASNVLPGAPTTTLTSTLQYQESGTSLRIKPRVNAGGLVIMDVMQEISTPTKVQVNGTDTFQFAQRKIHSSVAVPSGESLALGGLIQDKESDDVSGMPILSKIPYIGWLFSTTIKRKERTELVVLITPRTLEKRSDGTRVTNEFRRRLTGFGDLEGTGQSEPGYPR